MQGRPHAQTLRTLGCAIARERDYKGKGPYPQSTRRSARRRGLWPRAASLVGGAMARSGAGIFLASSGVWLGSDGDVSCAKRLVGAVSVVVKPPPPHTAPAGRSVAGCVRPMRTGAEMRSIVRRNPHAPRRRKFYSERQTPPMRRRTPTRHAHHAPSRARRGMRVRRLARERRRRAPRGQWVALSALGGSPLMRRMRKELDTASESASPRRGTTRPARCPHPSFVGVLAAAPRHCRERDGGV